MHKNAKMQMHFRVLRQSFCRKFKLSAGSGSQVSQLLECLHGKWSSGGILRSLYHYLFKNINMLGLFVTKLYLCIYMPWVKAIDHTRILPPADLLYLYLFPRYDHLKITKGTTSISSERAKMKEYTNFTVPRSFLLEL